MTLRRFSLSGPTFAAALLGACSHESSGLRLRDQSVILGEWNYASVARRTEEPSLNTGIHVTILIESIDGTQFRGHVTLWFVGDVGMPPAAFGPVTGAIGDAGAVTMRIPFTTPGAPAITVAGTVAGDVLTVHECMRGPDAGPFPHGAAFHRSHA